jgi:hypothetical protein
MGEGPYRMSDQVLPEEYYKRLAEHANKLVLKKPDLNLLRDHPKGEYPIILGNHLKTGHTLSLQNRPTG